MAMIEWNESLCVGVEFIDQDHQKLVELINKLHDAMSDGRGKHVLDDILNRLIDYTQYHFTNEEKAMITHAYPDYNTHKEKHDDLIRQAHEFQAEFESGKIVSALKIMTFLKEWLIDHILETDRELAAFLSGKI